MSDHFHPGTTPNTVRAADGRILTVPEGWGCFLLVTPPSPAG